jgi:hypothetical protein
MEHGAVWVVRQTLLEALQAFILVEGVTPVQTLIKQPLCPWG